jgi:hypothetical protein
VRSRAHTAQEMGRGCNDIQPTASLCMDWDTRKWVLKIQGGWQAGKVNVELREGRRGGCQTRGVDPQIGEKDIKTAVITITSRQRSAATFQSRNGKHDDALGRRQGRGVDDV